MSQDNRSTSTALDGVFFPTDARTLAIEVEPDGTIKYVSNEIGRALGVEPNSLIGTPLFKHISKFDLVPLFRTFVSITFGGAQEEKLAFRMRAQSGNWHTFKADVRKIAHGSKTTGVVMLLQLCSTLSNVGSVTVL